MATYSAEAVSATGTVPTSRTAAAGDKITPDTNLFLLVTNGGGAPITLTIAVPGNTSYGQANPDPVISITNGTTKAILMLSEYADPSDGLIALTWSATTSVTFNVIRV